MITSHVIPVCCFVIADFEMSVVSVELGYVLLQVVTPWTGVTYSTFVLRT